MFSEVWAQGGSAPCPVSEHGRLIHLLVPALPHALARAPSQSHPGQGTSDDLSWHRELSWGHARGVMETDQDKGRAQGSACSGSQLPSLHRAFTNPTDSLAHTQTSVTLQGCYTQLIGTDTVLGEDTTHLPSQLEPPQNQAGLPDLILVPQYPPPVPQPRPGAQGRARG